MYRPRLSAACRLIGLGLGRRRASTGNIAQERDPELECKYEAYFERPDIDGWEVRKAMNDLNGMDLVPEPRVICAGLRACRRVNDYALAVRFLEAVKFKCGTRLPKIYPYILQEIGPTLNELGIEPPERLGYDKPELVVKNVYEM